MDSRHDTVFIRITFKRVHFAIIGKHDHILIVPAGAAVLETPVLTIKEIGVDHFIGVIHIYDVLIARFRILQGYHCITAALD